VDLVPEYEAELYRKLHADLAQLGADELREHYLGFGRREGRRANRLRNRFDFVAQIPPTLRALEIGPFAAPLLAGPNVTYCDVLDRAGLQERAREHGQDAERVPAIHHVLGPAGLDALTERFEVVLSSHNIEHQPDLVLHLQQVQRRLLPGGRYFVLIPDQRYSFDRFNPPSSIAEVLEGHEARRTIHTLRSVIRHFANTTHNEFKRHWAEPNSAPAPTSFEALSAALNAYRSAAGGYLDVHGWYFTPDSFTEIVRLLQQLGEIDLSLERMHATRRNHNEFWVVLRSGEGALPAPSAVS
jgi:SAM-dependent methyltransferase